MVQETFLFKRWNSQSTRIGRETITTPWLTNKRPRGSKINNKLFLGEGTRSINIGCIPGGYGKGFPGRYSILGIPFNPPPLPNIGSIIKDIKLKKSPWVHLMEVFWKFILNFGYPRIISRLLVIGRSLVPTGQAHMINVGTFLNFPECSKTRYSQGDCLKYSLG